MSLASRLLFPLGLCAVISLVPAHGASASVPDAFTLEQAIAKTAAVHPQLRTFTLRTEVLQAEQSQAVLSPPLRVDLEIENFFGDAPFTNTRAAEVTLSLAGVLERGGKRDARVALAMRRIDTLAVERSIAELDVLAEVARRYVDWLEAVHARPLTSTALQRQRALVDSLQKRFKMGASPRALALAAEAELHRLEAEQALADSRVRATWQALAMMWGGADDTTVEQAPPLPASAPQLQSIEVLLQRLRDTPDIEYFASLERIKDAELKLVETRRSRDIDWQFGVRRLNADSANALVAGFSVPLVSRSRSDAELAVEQRKKRLVGAEREEALFALESLLRRVHAQTEQDLAQSRTLAQQVLPRLREAAAQGAEALARGAISYADQVQLQREVLVVERELLAVGLQVHRNLIEIQRLVAEPSIASSAQPGGFP